MPAQTNRTIGLARVDTLYQDRTKRARELHEAGQKVIGYMCCYVPLEMFTALDMVPLRITGDVHEPTTKADAYLESIMCGFVRSSFDLTLKGSYDFLDGLVMPHTCDTVVRIFDIWRYYKPYAFDHFLTVPHLLVPASVKNFKFELQRMRKALEEFAGTQLTDEKLHQAILLHNEHRALLRQLYDLRKPDPPLISGPEITRTVVARVSLPVREANDLVKQVIDEVTARKHGSPQKKAVRVLLYGPEQDSEDVAKLIEECGANVVIDDVCFGTRYFWHDVEPTGDPLDAISDRYLGKIPCPRTYHEPPDGDHQADLENRFGYLTEFMQGWQANAAIFYVVRFCDSHQFDVPDVRDFLQKSGYPVLHLEGDYNMGTVGQLRTRIEAFLEMID